MSTTSPPPTLRRTTSRQAPVRDAASAASSGYQPAWKSLLRGSGWAGILHASGIVGGLASNVLLARCMGQEAFGAYVVLLNAAIILSVVVAAGLPLAVLRLAPQYIAVEQPAVARAYAEKFYRWLARIAGVVALSAGIGLMVASSIGATSRPLTLAATVVLGLVLAGCNYQLELGRALKRLTLAYLPQKVVWPIATALFAGVAIACDVRLGLLPALVITALCLSVVFAVQLTLLRREVREISPTSASEPPGMWQTLALPLWGISLGTALLATADTIALSFVTDEKTVAIYFAVKRISLFTAFAPFAVSAYAAPRLAGLYHADDRSSLQRLLTQCAIITFVAGSSCAVLVFATHQPLLMLFGDDYVIGPACLVGLLVGQLIACANGCVGSLLTVAGMQWGTAAVHVGTGVLEALAVALAGWHFGVTGAAWAVAGTALTRNAIYFLMARRYLRVDPSLLGLLKRGLAC